MYMVVSHMQLKAADVKGNDKSGELELIQVILNKFLKGIFLSYATMHYLVPNMVTCSGHSK